VQAISFESRIATATQGFTFKHQAEQLRDLSIKENALSIANFLIECKHEGVDVSTRQSYSFTLCKLSEFIKQPFTEFTKDSILSYLDSLRKNEDLDPKHKWKGTYNLRIIHIGKFFKYLNKPELMEGIYKQKRKEKSIYSPSDLWSAEDIIIFVKYCPSIKIKCYLMVAIDSSCRPHEISKLKVKDVAFKQIEGKHYAEILVNGKTGSRHIPLINSIPYVKEWLDSHPIKSNPNSYFICALSKGLGHRVTTDSLNKTFHSYKTEYFPKLLNNPDVPQKDKDIITALLNKPFNPYIFRHTALTEKSKILKEHILRQHAGWSISSDMPQRYLHYFNNESSDSILEAYGLKPSVTQKDKLKPVSCPNCGTDNKIDSKFCSSCKLALTLQAWNEAEEESKSVKNDLTDIKKQMEELRNMMFGKIMDATKSKMEELKVKGITDFNQGVTQEVIKKHYEDMKKLGWFDEKDNYPLVGDLLDPTEAEFKEE
jgi:integrase/recombinase XerD